jgi:hypothetical protein
MNIEAYPIRMWWETLGRGLVPQAPTSRLPAGWEQARLEARIASRRAAAIARMKAIRTRSERAIEKLIIQAHGNPAIAFRELV